MTFEAWLAHAGASKNAIPEQRWGQVLFNTLADVRPDIAERLRGTAIDPFYNDGLAGDFLTAVAELWAE